MKKLNSRKHLAGRPYSVSRSILLLLILGSARAFAQTDADSGSGMPDGPLLKPAPNFSHWIIAYSYAEDRAPKVAGAPPSTGPADSFSHPRTINTTKTKETIHESIVDTQQHQRDNWYVGTTQYRKEASGQVWFVNQPDAHPDFFYTPLPSSGFRDLDWISAATYSGKGTQGGKPCLVFKTSGKLNSSDLGLPRGKEISMVAYIDAKSRLPIEVDLDKEIRTYTFSEPPEVAQNLPDDLLKQIKAGQAGRAVMAQPAERPY